MWILAKLALIFVMLAAVVAAAMAVSAAVSGVMCMRPEWRAKMKEKWPEMKERMMHQKKEEYEEKPM